MSVLGVVAVFALILAVGATAYYTSNSRSSGQTEAARGMEDADFGLLATTNSNADDSTKTDVHASWNQITNPPSGAKLTLTVRKSSGSLVSGATDKVVEVTATSKDFPALSLPDGKYYVQLKLVPTSGAVQRDTYEFTVGNSDNDESSNLIENGGFENLHGSGKYPLGWDFRGSKFKVISNKSMVYEGVNSVQAEDLRNSKLILLAPGKYTFSFYARRLAETPPSTNDHLINVGVWGHSGGGTTEDCFDGDFRRVIADCVRYDLTGFDGHVFSEWKKYSLQLDLEQFLERNPAHKFFEFHVWLDWMKRCSPCSVVVFDNFSLIRNLR